MPRDHGTDAALPGPDFRSEMHCPEALSRVKEVVSLTQQADVLRVRRPIPGKGLDVVELTNPVHDSRAP